tara:strand:+ start:11182 stop:11895 length:714 start_codon:yes stop_codon:yes gene_type:complete
MKQREHDSRWGIGAWYVGVAVFLSGMFLGGAIGFAEEEQPLVGDPVKGVELYKKSLCVNCHIIDHEALYEAQADGSKLLAGGRVGPTLTEVGLRRTEEHLSEFVYEPRSIYPETPMPQFPWKNPQEAADIAAFLMSTATSPDVAAVITQHGGANIAAGEVLVDAYDCRACHTIGEGEAGGGRAMYPNLTHIGSKIYREWEHIWLRDPDDVNEGTFMPNFNLSEDAITAVTTYLESLK